MAAFLVDTNVLVYAYDPADTAKQSRSIAVLTELGRNRSGALTAQVLSEFYVVATRKITPALTASEAEQTLVNYIRSWTIYDVTDAAVLEAVRAVQNYSLPYWDALIWATAKLNRVSNVLSEDFRDGSLIEGVRSVNPFAATFTLDLLRIGQ